MSSSSSFRRAVADAVTLSILLWKDATPSCTFPALKELVASELSRILWKPELGRAIPGLVAAIRCAPGLVDALNADPWDIDPKDVLHRYIEAISVNHDHDAIFRHAETCIRDSGHEDIVLDLIKYHNKPPTHTEPETIDDLAKKVRVLLGCDVDETPLAHSYVQIAYNVIYSDMVPKK